MKLSAANGLTAQKKKPSFSAAIQGDALQGLIRKSVPSADAAARLTGALISAVSASEQLRNCSPASIVAAALKGEGQGLTIGREYHLVPFGENCTYIVSYKGLIALTMATGEVADMDCVEVREGEYRGRDRRTKRPAIDFSVYETDEESQEHPIVGYYAYVEMKDGYFRSEYMSVKDIISHAAQYSKSFDVNKFNRFSNGEMTPDEMEKAKKSSPWFSSTDAMMKKTVIRKLLNSGYVRLANTAAITNAMSNDKYEDAILGVDLAADPDTGEVIEADGEVVESAETDGNAPDADIEPTTNERTNKAKSTRKAKSFDSGAKNGDTDDFEQSFFGGRA